MMTIPPAIGAILVLSGLALFIVDLSVTNHGLPTAGALLALLAGGLVLLMGGLLYGILGSLRASKGRPAITGRDGMIGEVGTVRSPVGVESAGWIFVHGERWRAVLAFAPEESDPRDREPVVGVGSKVAVVGFGEGGVVQVVPVEWPLVVESS
jgi:membrane-bound ClpP family serine protease